MIVKLNTGFRGQTRIRVQDVKAVQSVVAVQVLATALLSNKPLSMKEAISHQKPAILTTSLIEISFLLYSFPNPCHNEAKKGWYKTAPVYGRDVLKELRHYSEGSATGLLEYLKD